MISMKQIKKVVNENLFTKFGIMPTVRDITEGFDRPSFFVDIKSKKKDQGTYLVECDVAIKIYYFPEKEEVNQLLDMQEDIEALFTCKLKVDDRYINIEDAEGDITSSVLTYSINLHYTDAKDYLDEQGELAGEIIVKTEL